MSRYSFKLLEEADKHGLRLWAFSKSATGKVESQHLLRLIVCNNLKAVVSLQVLERPKEFHGFNRLLCNHILDGMKKSGHRVVIVNVK